MCISGVVDGLTKKMASIFKIAAS